MQTFDWRLSYSTEKNGTPKDPIPATVPGAVGLDYAKAKNYPPYYFGTNFKLFDWMEDCFFFYDTTLRFDCKPGETALLSFEGIDYRYEITLDGRVVSAGEGAFTPVRLDVTEYAGRNTALRVTLFPVPKVVPTPQDRSQAAGCCKPASSYGWDWHPRLIPSGLWKEVYLEILAPGTPRFPEVSYRLSEDLTSVVIEAQVTCFGNGPLTAELLDPAGVVVAAAQADGRDREAASFVLSLENPQLWYPRGYGDQPRYTLRVAGSETVTRKLGFRRSKLVLNQGATDDGNDGFWPRGPLPVPMQLEINGVPVFVKGSNWVNTEIFPCLATNQRYDELLQMAYDANMNLLRIWGGQYINHEHFYDRCDELGILIWQEFMLSCNGYPDEDGYLAVLEQEATTIIKRLRSHPCLAFWCGGNELFNTWSWMTCQSHPIRLLDRLCYELDRFTPFHMTSPLHGVSHGSYVKAVPPDVPTEEFICRVKQTRSTAYTEFGCNGASPKEYLLKYIMDEETYRDCNKDNPVWVGHHGFDAWEKDSWLGIPEVDYFFGGHTDVDDMVEKSIYLQDLGYISLFEEMRRQAPYCAMAVNWDFNEPWPCAAGNSLVNWPAEPKSALQAVAQALRPTLLSLEAPRNRYLTGETLTGTVWILNDAPDGADPVTAQVYLLANGEKKLLCTLETGAVAPRSNGKFGGFTLPITEDLPERFAVTVECEARPEWNSTYRFVHRVK